MPAGCIIQELEESPRTAGSRKIASDVYRQIGFIANTSLQEFAIGAENRH